MRGVAHVLDDPTGLSLRARRFLAARATRREALSPDRHREHWRAQHLPEPVVELCASFQERWGGLSLPPTTHYDGGPTCLAADRPRQVDGLGWCLEAGQARAPVPYGFYVDEAGRYGVEWKWQVPLHETVEGWVEACALEDAAGGWDLVARSTGQVNELLTTWLPQVGPLAPLPEVRGIADTWWQGDGVIVRICSGLAQLYDDGFGEVEPEGFLYAVS
jgi:hypothetical protein